MNKEYKYTLDIEKYISRKPTKEDIKEKVRTLNEFGIKIKTSHLIWNTFISNGEMETWSIRRLSQYVKFQATLSPTHARIYCLQKLYDKFHDLTLDKGTELNVFIEEDYIEGQTHDVFVFGGTQFIVPNTFKRPYEIIKFIH